MRTAIVNGNLFDTTSMELVGDRTVVIEGDRIVDVADRPPSGDVDRTIDAAGKFVLPGFVDAHVHHLIVTMDFRRLLTMSVTERSVRMAQLAEATVRRGFTTVRDTGGDVQGLIQAIDGGVVVGPRIVASGRVISQTGGHGDVRAGRQEPGCGCQIDSEEFAHIADGPDAVRRAVRHNLRDGSEFIKIMTSGGVASPSDPFDSMQFTAEEVRAATVETDHRHTYTTSHAYQPDAIRLAVDNGVRCIEHGNEIDASTAEHLAALGVTVVPTLVTYQAMAEIGAKVGLPARNIEKNEGVFDAGRAAIGIATAAGVDLGFGTDLLGEAQPWQNREFAIRAELQPAADVWASMYRTNPVLCRLEGEIGVLAPGAAADVVVADADPLDDLAAYADPDAVLSAVVARGSVVFDRT